MAANITQIPAPRVPLVDVQTNTVSREWFMWFNNIYTITGTGTGITAVINGGTGLGTIPTNGQLLIGNGTGYSLNTLFPSAGISVSNGSGSISIANTGVLSNIASTGISVSSATGNVTITNTLPDKIVALTGAGTTTVTGTYPNFTITSNDAYVGTVTSVGLSLPAEFTISNSPVTTAGTLTGVWASQTAKYFFAAPNATAGTPSFRAIVASDIPALSYAPPTSGTAILYGNGTGGFSSVTIGSGVSFAAGTLSATGSGGTVTSVTATAPVASTGGTTPVISMPAATTSVSGYLTSTDWNTFNGKQPAGTYVNSVSGTTGRITSTGGVTPVIDLASGIATAGTTGSSTLIPVVTIDTYGRVTSITTAANPQGTVTSVTGTAPVVSSGGATPAISMAAATTSVSGYLTSTDWTTFNNKGSGSVTSVSFTGGIISVATGTTTPAFTVAGTSGGIPYFASGTTWASSAALTQYGVVYGGGAGAAPVATAAGTTGQVLTATTGGAPTWAAPATSGTVTSVSVVSANGFTGTVATATTTPAITLTTSITGLLKGNGTAISAAVANTDYVPLSTVLTKTADYTIANTDTWIINNKTGSALTLTFPAASAWPGRSITVKNLQAQLVNSASSNIVPIDSATAGTAILLNVVGNWAMLVSDGTNWIIMHAAANNCLLLE